jgi:hypothetical protein
MLSGGRTHSRRPWGAVERDCLGDERSHPLVGWGPTVEEGARGARQRQLGDSAPLLGPGG